MAIAILVIYAVLLSFILLFSFMQLRLALAYLNKHKYTRMIPPPNFGELPIVTIQLPLYNERHVAERLIDQVAKMDWPHDRLEVQVIDDSTDETVDLAAARIAHWQAEGIDMIHIRRADREGFKAGALAYGLKIAKGEFIAVFDADFMPPTDMLQVISPWFNDPKIGMVQTRWDHLNRNSNLLTELQAFGLDAHFSVEQVGRNGLRHFINFNGTAGVWRKAGIVAVSYTHLTLPTSDLV